MTKIIYTHEKVSTVLGFVKSQDWLQAQADAALASGNKVVRVFSGEGKGRVLQEVIVC